MIATDRGGSSKYHGKAPDLHLHGCPAAALFARQPGILPE
jgi:hypothetical protein